MELTVTEAATLLGRRPRTVRSQLVRGVLPGFKRDGRWVIRDSDLPMTDADHAALHDKVATLRGAAEAGIPRAVRERLALGGLEQLDVFRIMREVLVEMTAADAPVAEACQTLRPALDELAIGHLQFDPSDKHRALNRARAGIARTLAALLLDQPAPGSPTREWATRLEADALPRLAGLIRWSERLAAKAAR